MKHKQFFVLLFSAFFSFFLSAQNKNTVFLISQNQMTYERLDANEKLYARSAFQSFVGNFTLLDNVTVRTEANDSSLRQLQKQSQIEASRGLVDEKSAYASDLVSKAALRIEISLVKYKDGYKLEYSASNIETMQIVSSASSDKYFMLDSIDLETDLLSYNAMKALYAKGYVSEIPYNVEIQLTHSEDSSENYAKYILELSQSIDENREELEKINRENLTAAERAEVIRKEQALQQKIMAAENAKRRTEEQLRKSQEEKEKILKQDAELKALAAQKKTDLAKKFQEKIKENQMQQDKLNKAISQGLSLEKRIELIESDRKVLDEIESQLLYQIENSSEDFYKKRDAEIDEVYNTPWRLAETDANGNPTEKAKKYRDSKVNKINEKYEKLINASNSELKSAYMQAITAYEKQIADGVRELESTTFVFRSYEKGSSLSVNVGNYDGEKCLWNVVPDFELMDSEYISAVPELSILGCTLSYRDISGKNPVEYDGMNDEAYNEYMDFAELADLCFRTSTPYIYGIFSVKVRYNSTYGDYRIVFDDFKLIRMEDDLLLAHCNLEDYKAVLHGKSVNPVKSNTNKEKYEKDDNLKRARENRLKRQEEFRQEQHSKVKGVLGNIIDYWTPNFKQKSSVTVNLNTDVLSLKSNADCRFVIGGGKFFYLVLSGGFDNFDGVENLSLGLGLGTSFNFGCFRPYSDISLCGGVVANSNHREDDKNLRFSTRSGLDINIGSLVLGSFVNFEIRADDIRSDLRHYETIGFSLGYSF